MNIFVLDPDPVKAAEYYCDKHVPKMCVELYQQLGSAVIRHGATPDQMPLTSKGTPLTLSIRIVYQPSVTKLAINRGANSVPTNFIYLC